MPEEVVSGMSQRELSQQIESKLHDNLISQAASQREKARLLSIQLPHAGDWLQAVPSAALGLQLGGPEF